MTPTTVRPELVEGLPFSLIAGKEVRPFDSDQVETAPGSFQPSSGSLATWITRANGVEGAA